MTRGLRRVVAGSAMAFLLATPAGASDVPASGPEDAAEWTELVERLGLTAEQAEGMAAILAVRDAQGRTDRASAGADARERLKRAKARFDTARTATLLLLSADQRDRYAALQAERRERARQRLEARRQGDPRAPGAPESPAPGPPG